MMASAQESTGQTVLIRPSPRPPPQIGPVGCAVPHHIDWYEGGRGKQDPGSKAAFFSSVSNAYSVNVHRPRRSLSECLYERVDGRCTASRTCPGERYVVVAAKRCQVSGTPLSSTRPRSLNSMPEP